MTIATHCGTPAAGFNGVPGFPGMAQFRIPSGGLGSGNIRGVVLHMHGMGETGTTSFPPLLLDTTGILPAYNLTLDSDLVADGWITIYPGEVGDAGLGNGIVSQVGAVYTEVQADAGHGSSYVASVLHWFQHAIAVVRQTFGQAIPIVVHGFSWGGWHAATIAKYRPGDIVAASIHHPALVLSSVNPLFTNPFNFTSSNTSGLDIASTDLNTCPIPLLIGWGTGDIAVDYPQSGDLLTPALYAAAHGAGASVSPNCNGTGASSGGSAENHVLTMNDVTAITAWFTSAVDPLCPKAF